VTSRPDATAIDILTFGRLRHFGPPDRWLLLLSIGGSAAYLATRAIQPFPGSVVLKALGMAPLAVLAFRVLGKTKRERRERDVWAGDHWILAAALTLSCLGDVFLHLGARRYFMHALAAFLLAHVAYIFLFTRQWPRPLRPTRPQVILTALVLVYSLLLTSWLWAGLGAQVVPVMAYAVAITAMTMAAILAGFSRPYVCVGAMLFVLSDSLIAAGRFMMPLPMAAYLIWPTYYLGQYAITMGFLREKVEQRSP
jgi:uncharacterized membrane protein YhhN